MKQINPVKTESDNQNTNSLKLLGHKTKKFKVIYKIDNENPDSKLNEGRWTYEEQMNFIIGIGKNGTNWKKIKKSISTRSLSQIRSHAQKFYNKLKMCKNDQLGIDFTSNEIKSIKDMIYHIKSININYDIAKIFLFFYNKLNGENKNEKQTDENHSKNFIKEEDENPTNKEKLIFPQVFKDNNNVDINKILLLNYIHNVNNINLLTLNYYYNSSIANNYMNFLLNMNYLQSLNKNPKINPQPFLFNGINIIPSLDNNFVKNINISKFK